MFTGIVEEVGKVRELRSYGDGARIVVASPFIWEELAIGESVCVNGVCLTVVEKGGGTFTADISEESLARSTLGSLKRDTPLNLERALSLASRLGGHIVQGHVDAVGDMRGVRGSSGGSNYIFSYPENLKAYMVEKGSIAVDGISLTISALGKDDFKVAVIPHTRQETNLKWLKVGDPVNLETDILAKYVSSLLQSGVQAPGTSTQDQGGFYDKLIEGGFA